MAEVKITDETRLSIWTRLQGAVYDAEISLTYDDMRDKIDTVSGKMGPLTFSDDAMFVRQFRERLEQRIEPLVQKLRARDKLSVVDNGA